VDILCTVSDPKDPKATDENAEETEEPKKKKSSFLFLIKAIFLIAGLCGVAYVGTKAWAYVEDFLLQDEEVVHEDYYDEGKIHDFTEVEVEGDPNIASLDVITVFDGNVSRGLNASMRDEVMERIDSIPNVDTRVRREIYTVVEGAKSIGRLLTVRFKSGSKALTREQGKDLKGVFSKDTVLEHMNNPNTLVVVAGFSDIEGDAEKNRLLSTLRANLVVKFLDK